MTDHDRSEHAGNGDGERVVVRDRRRIDPVTGDVRAPAEEPSAGAAPEAGGSDAGGSDAARGFDAAEGDVPVTETGLDPRVEELTAEVAERTADLQRVSAEYANYRRRVDRDRESVLVGARVQFVSELLTTLDDIDRAAAHGDLTGPFKAVADKIVAVAQKQGLEPFAADGDLFDPSVHEAVQHESGDVTGPTVAVVSSVLRRGYRIADRVLRPAMVTVVDRSVDEAAPEPAQTTEQ